MALAYTAPTWEDGSGTGISASQLQAICNCIESLVQGTDKAVHAVSMTGSVITLTFADGTQETVQTSGLKGIVSIAKTGTSGYVDTYTITYTDGTSTTFTVTNGEEGSTPNITANASVSVSTGTPSVNVVKTGTDAAPVFTFNFSGLKGEQGATGQTGSQGPAGQDGDDGVSPTITITTITGGHRVTITDADHPSGQSFDVMDGTGSGDMTKAVYDSNNTVANAGGITSYVQGLGHVESVTLDHNGTASASATRVQRVGVDGTYTEIDGTKYMESSTSTTSNSVDTFTFSNAAITSNSVVDVYCDKPLVAPTAITLSSGSLAVSFNSSDSVGTCRVYLR